MSKKEAEKILRQAISSMKLTLQDHQILQQALTVLAEVEKVSPLKPVEV